MLHSHVLRQMENLEAYSLVKFPKFIPNDVICLEDFPSLL